MPSNNDNKSLEGAHQGIHDHELAVENTGQNADAHEGTELGTCSEDRETDSQVGLTARRSCFEPDVHSHSDSKRVDGAGERRVEDCLENLRCVEGWTVHREVCVMLV